MLARLLALQMADTRKKLVRCGNASSGTFGVGSRQIGSIIMATKRRRLSQQRKMTDKARQAKKNGAAAAQRTKYHPSPPCTHLFRSHTLTR